MLYGIDISNWQRDITVPDVDFCICKATEGTRYVDPCCDGFVQQCVARNVAFGFYHFAAGASEPEAEAMHFRKHTKGYELLGVPVLDMEFTRHDQWGAWAQRFVDKYHAATGVYPLIYASAAYLGRFAGYPLTQTCGLWVAGYPSSREVEIGTNPGKLPYATAPWEFAAIWQYSASGVCDSWGEHIDLDVAYMDRSAWARYANPEQAIEHTQQMPAADAQTTGRDYHVDLGPMTIDVHIK